MLGKMLNPLAFGGLFEQGAQQSCFGQLLLQSNPRPTHPAKMAKYGLREKAAVARTELTTRPHPLRELQICGTTAMNGLFNWRQDFKEFVPDEGLLFREVVFRYEDSS